MVELRRTGRNARRPEHRVGSVTATRSTASTASSVETGTSTRVDAPPAMDHPNSPRHDRCGVAWQDLGGLTFAEIQHLEEEEHKRKKAWSCCSRRDDAPEPDLEAPKLGSAKLWLDVSDSDEEAKEERGRDAEEPTRGE